MRGSAIQDNARGIHAVSKTTLKTLRLIVPGVMTITFASLLFKSSLQDLSQFLRSLEGLLYLVIVFPIGYLYNIMNIRGPFLRDSLSLVQANIKGKLAAPFCAGNLIGAKVESLTQGRQLMHVFYSIVDNDESLKSKTQDVYQNGLLWSTTADVMAVTLFFIPVYLFAYLFKPMPHYLVVALGLCITYLFAALVLMPKVTSRHIELSNDQLDFILQRHPDELYEQLLNLASGQPVESVATPDDPKAQ
ncbi:MAG: hypothetical protein CEE40_09680 [Chloroflexi bacterium B3_Chlor]|nr:MAG: hypothetical protein CEE40_09680 [Chloroflexi bacterium B3_Chlor]